MRYLPIVCLIVVSVMLSGCGNSEPQAEIVKTVPASGTLTYRGKPLANHEVGFYPIDGRRAAKGTTDEQGRFTLGTNGPDDGAVAGEHKVMIISAGPTSFGEPGKEDPTKMPVPQVIVPEKYSNAETSGLIQTIPESGATDIKIELQ